MKKGILFLMLSVLTIGAWAQTFKVVDDKVMVKNNLNQYEEYGIYERWDDIVYLGYIEAKTNQNANDTHPYIDTEYIHLANTKVVAEVMLTENTIKDYEAVFGARANITSQAFLFFSRFGGDNKGCWARDATEYQGSTDHRLPQGQKITITAGPKDAVVKDASGNTVHTYTASTGTTAGNCPLYIFDTNNKGTRNGVDNSWGFFKLYSFKIYEGNDLVHDFRPAAKLDDEGNVVYGLHDLIAGTFKTSANSATFAHSEEYTEDELKAKLSTPTTYTGKLVHKHSDGHQYKWNGSSWVDCGNALESISNTGYQNMKSEANSGGWKCRFGFASTYGSITNSDTNNNYFNPYRGASGWEPYQTTLTGLTSGAQYRVSFNFSSEGWTSWSSYTELPVFVITPNQFTGETNRMLTDMGNSNVLGFVKLSQSPVSNQPCFFSFTANGTEDILAIQFGVVNDNVDFKFHFDNLLVQKYTNPETYPDMTSFKTLYNTLSETYAMCTSEGVTGTELNNNDGTNWSYSTNDLTNAKNILDNGAEESGFTNALLQLRMCRKAHAAERHEISFSGHEPEDGHSYYLYNVGQKQFFCGGSSYGAHAALGWPGILVTLTAGNNDQGDGFIIDTHLQNGSGEHYLNAVGFCDTGSQDVWGFQSIGDGKYLIQRPDNRSVYMGYNPKFEFDGDQVPDGQKKLFDNVGTSTQNSENPNNHWILVTAEDRAALLSEASVSNPVDVSYKIKMPNFNQREYVIDGGWQKTDNNPNGAWTMSYEGTGGRGIWDRGANHPDFVFESWNDATLNLSQEIADLEPGIYKVSVQGYYRHGNYEQQVSDYQNNSIKTNGAYFYAKGLQSSTTFLVPITNELDKAPGEGRQGDIGRFPDACTAAATYFEYGLYKNELEVIVGLDGTLEIGVIKTENNMPKDWVVVDNFRLTYLGGYREMSENDDNSGINETAYVVKLGRTLKAGYWNTFCVPFAMEKSLLGANAEVKELTGATKNGDNYTMTFSDAGTIDAGKPYMVRVAENEYNGTIEIENASGIAVNTTGTPFVTEDGVTFTGVYTSGLAPRGSFIISNNVFYNVDSDVSLKAFRGYITVDSGSGVKALDFTFDDDATGISDLKDSKDLNDSKVIYNLAGQRISKMQKGINIVNGKKILK